MFAVSRERALKNVHLDAIVRRPGGELENSAIPVQREVLDDSHGAIA